MSTEKNFTYKKLESKYGELSFGSLLKAYREAEELSQEAFAKLLGGSGRSYVSNLENGHYVPSPEKAAEIAELVGGIEIQFVELAVRDELRNLGYDCKIKIKKVS